MKSAPVQALILGGTKEARDIIAPLSQIKALSLTVSLAGATPNPALLSATMRIGGFGGSEGLAKWCLAHQIKMILDLTHPYAQQISAHAVIAAQMANIPLLAYWRPRWEAKEGDNWQHFDDWRSMIAALPKGAHGFVAGGNKMLAELSYSDQVKLTIRALAIPSSQLDKSVTMIKGSPGRVEQEEALFKKQAITHILCKNSGGSAAEAKLIAARTLGIPVWMLARPARQPQQIYSQLEEVIAAAHDRV